jgi:hypothetical protein
MKGPTKRRSSCFVTDREKERKRGIWKKGRRKEEGKREKRKQSHKAHKHQGPVPAWSLREKGIDCQHLKEKNRLRSVVERRRDVVDGGVKASRERSAEVIELDFLGVDL